MEKYYVSGVKTDAKGHCEICDDDSANFYTLYERNESGESQGIIDLNFREDADAAMKVYVERNALQQQVNALAAEGVNEFVEYSWDKSARPGDEHHIAAARADKFAAQLRAGEVSK
ncbi:hypothetical protein AV903_04455 [Erwinia tracheiphila]|uniref:Phage protein n=2 Tax=Erwinia tracheiphila TaxID=65700 RepID=A0A345CQ11_9GAMM|nr:hypothetical protein AV903_04455 [Erwinia tracheiphila]